MDDLDPNDPPQIGRYRLTARLGRGGMGTVYLGEDATGRQAAVKVINPEYSRHEQFRMRFRREADAAGRVRRFCTAAVIAVETGGQARIRKVRDGAGGVLARVGEHGTATLRASFDNFAMDGWPAGDTGNGENGQNSESTTDSP
ncbi:hypothetical protein [Spongiactinospora sp. TRM90649]|uniref:hypothetical protein n=1 Tax=Spongiactinospora sp. TRM90649 TaxID=3031114 RepID=UPI0023F786A3|nr:hypothetical protein [Spongiactinospora sp. TRM90649]MDF5758685.1 hypothetical protein [Spongiactinospora sp. TRM90649]